MSGGNGNGRKVGAALVVGGGIGGMQAALDLAASGIKVVLAEKKSSIGGVMSQLDKTFPTNDCAMCTQAPRLVEIGKHRDVETLTLTEVETLEGEAGNFRATLKQAPRYIDAEKCTGCATCATVCPVDVPSVFEMGLVTRKAIHRNFPQAVPGAFAIERAGPAPCKATCPAGQDVQGYLALVAVGKFEQALEVIRRTNPLPGVCGRVCFHTCEAQCNRRFVDEPIAIRSVKRFVTERAAHYARPPRPVAKSGKKVAVVGSGPAGLAAAHTLALEGHAVTIFEAASEPGGMLRVGIPAYRLPRNVLDADVDVIRELGVEIVCNHRVSAEELARLRGAYDAVFVGAGAHVGASMGVAGEDLAGVVPGVDFLRQANAGVPVRVGRRVAVIGGGNTAIDVARTAIRLGAESVEVLYRRTGDEMPADKAEIDALKEEGIRIRFLVAPSRVVGEQGKLTGLELIRMTLGEPDASGRRQPLPVPGSAFVVPYDMVLPAVSQRPDSSFLEGSGCALGRQGTVTVDALTMATNVPGLYSGGDQVRGPASVVEAIADGRRAAKAIANMFAGRPASEGLVPPVRAIQPGDEEKLSYRLRHFPSPRQAVPKLSAPVRVRSFDEVELGLSEKQAIAEAARCMDCGVCCGCRQCVTVCEAKAIDLDQKPQRLVRDVGAVVLAPGYELFDARKKPDLGYGRFPNVVTALEFERILSASGPYSGHVLRPSDRTTPRRIAFVQCVGSRDAERDWCSSVCCMYATKEALMAKEHVGADLVTDVFFMDARAFGKGFEAYYQRALAQGVRYVRCRPPAIQEVPGSRNLRIEYVTEDDTRAAREYDLVVLSTGLLPPKDAPRLAQTFGIGLDARGFCRTGTFHPVETTRPGVFACGPFTEPKDIPETVMQASGAASKALSLLAEARGTLLTPRTYPPERDVAAEEPRVGVFVCHCGSNIAGVVDVKEVAAYAGTLPGVAHAETNLYTCSNDTQQRIRALVAEHGLNRVVVASCSPRTHEPLFRDTCREAGLNAYLFEMANIRDQCSWVHMAEPAAATEKARDLVRMAVAKARLLSPLSEGTAPVKRAALVIGGGLAGMTAALELADQGVAVSLVEREDALGGNLRRVRYLDDGDDPQAELSDLVERVTEHPRIHALTSARVTAIEGSVGTFVTTVAVDGREERIEHGTVVVATGAKEHRPEGFLYGEDERVVTQLELEERLATRGREALPQTVVMIQCVGSRDEAHPYCSRVCCAGAIKNALKIKALSPATNVYVLYRDIRTYGARERFYTEARRKGVVFLRHEDGVRPSVARGNGKLAVTVRDPQLGREVVLEAGLVVLSAGVVPHEDGEEVAKLLKVPRNQDGFFLEAHMKLRPVDFATDGVFLAGLAHSPKLVEETVAQAGAAAARAATVLAKDHIDLPAQISCVDEEKCDGCAYCVDPCPYHALTLVEYASDGGTKKKVVVNESLCKGCGTCQATCPKRGIYVRGFTLDQISAQVEAALEVVA